MPIYADKKRMLEARANEILKQLERLNSLPPEPESPWADGKISIYFEITFNQYRNMRYSYSAHKANNGLWYTTARQVINNGVNLRDGMEWETLIDWILTCDKNAEVWLVTELERLV